MTKNAEPTKNGEEETNYLVLSWSHRRMVDQYAVGNKTTRNLEKELSLITR